MQERRSARAGLDSARAAVARLDDHRGPEDLAADLIETWTAIETALRTAVGSTALSGQPLIREARQRQIISFDQANSIAEFQAVNDRVQDVAYRPNAADLAAAKTAFEKLDAGLAEEPVVEVLGNVARPTLSGAPINGAAAAGEVKSMPYVAPGTGPVKVVGPPSRFPMWLLATLGVVVIAVLGVGGYLLFGARRSSALEQGINAYRAGQREIAVSDFSRAARDDPRSPVPHVYLARMAREVGNATLASQELQLALQADPGNAAALREMGANLLALGNFELARRFYVRAVQADPSDKTSMGYLGCTLMRLNRAPEATSFLNRAGPGPWSNCTPVPAQGAQPGVIPR